MTYKWAVGTTDFVEYIEIILPFDAVNTLESCQQAVKAVQIVSDDAAKLTRQAEEHGVFEIGLEVNPHYQRRPVQVIPLILNALRNLPVSKATYLLTYPGCSQVIAVFEEVQ